MKKNIILLFLLSINSIFAMNNNTFLNSSSEEEFIPYLNDNSSKEFISFLDKLNDNLEEEFMPDTADNYNFINFHENPNNFLNTKFIEENERKRKTPYNNPESNLKPNKKTKKSNKKKEKEKYSSSSEDSYHSNSYSNNDDDLNINTKSRKHKTPKYNKKHHKKNKPKSSGYDKKYYQANKQKIKEYQKKYKQRNKEKIKKTNKKYKQKKKNIISEKNKKYYQANKAKLAEYHIKYKQKNKNIISEKNKKYYQKNKTKISENQKKNRQNNKEKIFNKLKRILKNKGSQDLRKINLRLCTKPHLTNLVEYAKDKINSKELDRENAKSLFNSLIAMILSKKTRGGGSGVKLKVLFNKENKNKNLININYKAQSKDVNTGIIEKGDSFLDIVIKNSIRSEQYFSNGATAKLKTLIGLGAKTNNVKYKGNLSCLEIKKWIKNKINN